jgi:hypothetical protein
VGCCVAAPRIAACGAAAACRRHSGAQPRSTHVLCAAEAPSDCLAPGGVLLRGRWRGTPQAAHAQSLTLTPGTASHARVCSQQQYPTADASQLYTRRTPAVPRRSATPRQRIYPSCVTSCVTSWVKLGISNRLDRDKGAGMPVIRDPVSPDVLPFCSSRPHPRAPRSAPCSLPAPTPPQQQAHRGACPAQPAASGTRAAQHCTQHACCCCCAPLLLPLCHGRRRGRAARRLAPLQLCSAAPRSTAERR